MKAICMLLGWYVFLFCVANTTNFILILMSEYYG